MMFLFLEFTSVNGQNLSPNNCINEKFPLDNNIQHELRHIGQGLFNTTKDNISAADLRPSSS